MMKVNQLMFLLVIPLFIQQASAQGQETSPVKLKLISGNVYEILDGRGSNGGAYIGENGILVIDAKMDQESVDQTISELQKISDMPILYLVNTHSDGDHINGNRYFPESITIVAHENCRNDFFLPKRDGSPSDWNNPELAPFTPELTFSEKMDIYLGPEKVELWYFGIGHTTGDIVVYFPEEKIAFLGDQLFIERPQLIHSYKGGNSFEHVSTLTRMLETLDAEKFSSGHSEICDKDAILKHISDIQEYQKKVIKLVENNKTLEEVIGNFGENEARLVTSIYNEVKETD
ncbi:MAG: MBL fold metallo-hydrolase [Bacteroidales bacterium]|nr:MBL fold metallo-hydrolase [Bacteroidales bacterium]